ncbi:hypothetical protein BDV59DRAFT_187244 [Aspergillus ambiguus]|uniref:uncharacterized protein n=1 Tax=Aspergillus ambiguus TaxID=176160 RepID=UPI003CCD298B
MPRPRTKRNRLASKAITASQESSTEHASKSREPKQLEKATSQPLASPPRVEIIQRKDQTPMTTSHEQVIESSPIGERTATGSRPTTRSRGYSSTLSIAGRKGDMSSKIPGTPAFENSVLSNFRRRPRQPSILQVMQAEDRSSDLDDDDFLGGLSPEDESTPLNVSRGKSILAQNNPPSSPSEAQAPSSGSSRKRKRSSANIEIQVPQSSLGLVEDSPVGTPTPEVEGQASFHMPPPPPPPRSPDVFSQTMAPPMSSPQGTPSQLTVISDPPPKAGIRPDMSTASLQDKLLPRRRQRPRRRRNMNHFDVPSDSSEHDESSVESDQDELSYISTLKSTRSQRNRTTKSKPPHNSHKQKAKQKTAQKVAQGKEKTGSARRREDGEMDKENELADGPSPESDSVSSPPERYLSEELRLQAKKFAEVDEWQMDFEDVPASQESTYR